MYPNEFSECITKVYKWNDKHQMWFSTFSMYKKPFVNKIYSYTRIEILTYGGIVGQPHEIFNTFLYITNNKGSL